MLISPDIMRYLLLGCMLSLMVLAAFYLRRRELSIYAYIGWGLIAVVVPIIGPFLVIWAQPGARREV